MQINRFLIAACLIWAASAAMAQEQVNAAAMSVDATAIEADVVILGGSPSGIAAAVQAARMGSSVIIVEPYLHIGGMISGGLTKTDFGDQKTTGGFPVEFFKRIAKEPAPHPAKLM